MTSAPLSTVLPTVQWQDGQFYTVRNIYCIGRNYADHRAEMGSSKTEDPVVFLKPTHALVQAPTPLILPSYSSNVHFEGELVLAIGNTPPDSAASNEDWMACVSGYALGLDITARDIQTQCKTAGLPWTRGKGFKTSAGLTPLRASHTLPAWQTLGFSLSVNNTPRQSAVTTDMTFSLPTLLRYIADTFGLDIGDLIYTGTPAGVGQMIAGDTLTLRWAHDDEATSFKVKQTP